MFSETEMANVARSGAQISVLPRHGGRDRYHCCRVTEGGSILMFSETEMANVAAEQVLGQKSASLLSG
jgi:hypothetical protein